MSTVAQETTPLPAAPAGTPSSLRIDGKYLSLTTFRRDGSPVATPLWFVEDDGRLCVITGGDSYKARRIRRNPAVRVASCNARGAIRGAQYDARAEFMPESEHERIDRLMAKKYRVDRILILPIYRFVMKLTRKGRDETGTGAYLVLTSTDGDRELN